MAARRRRQVEEQIIAPVLPPPNIENDIVDRLECLRRIVMSIEMLIHIHHQQFERRIARTLAHAVERAVDENSARSVEIEKSARVCITELEIVMRVESELDLRREMLIENVCDMQQVLIVEQAVRIDRRRGERHHFIHRAAVFDEFFIAVSRDRNHLREHFIAECFDLSTKFERGGHFMFLENYANAVDERLGLGLKIFDRAGAEIDHREHGRVAFVDVCEYFIGGLRVRHDRPIDVEIASCVEEADLDEVDAGAHQPREYLERLVMTELPIIDVAAVSESAIEQFNPSSHVNRLP